MAFWAYLAFSQPWNVIGGHGLSAIIGVACWQLIPDYTVATVIGSEKLHDLGYAYAYEPILLI
jgi:hypothetical protein